MEIRQRFFVSEIGVFGSYVRGEQRPNSDVDIIVVFCDGHNDIFNYSNLKSYLEELIGIEVDLVVKSGLKPESSEQILSDTQYA